MGDDYNGCGDGCCIVEKPKGVHTNGGCRCLPINGRLSRDDSWQAHNMRVRRGVAAKDQRIATLTEALEAAVRGHTYNDTTDDLCDDCGLLVRLCRDEGTCGTCPMAVARRALNPSTPGKTGGGDGA